MDDDLARTAAASTPAQFRRFMGRLAYLRRLACEAHIIPVVLNGDGVPLDVGRSRRLATDDQRRALRTMYRTCGVGDCDVPFDRCEIHHLDDWDAHHGETNLDRLISHPQPDVTRPTSTDRRRRSRTGE